METFSLNTKPESFRKGFNPQSCLVVMIEKFKKSRDQGGEYATLLTDLSKVFNCLPQSNNSKTAYLRI